MKKYIFVFAALVMALIMGCSRNNAQKQVDKLMNNIQQGCQLTPDQANKVRPMVQDFVNARIAARKKYGDDQEAIRKFADSARKDFKNKLGTVLSKDQMQQLMQHMKEQRDQRRAQQPGGDNE